MRKAGKDAISALVYVVFCGYLFYRHFPNFGGYDLLIPVNCCLAAFGCYLLSKRWVAGTAGSVFAGAIYGFGPFMLFLIGYHQTAGCIAAAVPWLFLPAVYGPRGQNRWLRIPLCALPFLGVIIMFRLAALVHLYPVPVGAQIQVNDLSAILAPVALMGKVQILIGFYHVPIAALVLGIAMLIASRRYSVMAVFLIGVLLSIFDCVSGTARVMWLSVPLLCCCVLTGEGIEGLIHCGYRDRKWVLASGIVLLVCAVVSLLYAVKAAEVIFGFGMGYTGRFTEAAHMYIIGAIAIGTVFFLAKGKSRLLYLRLAIICAAMAVDIFSGAVYMIDRIMGI